MKELPIGIQTFSKFSEGNFLYIDKTKDIYHLISNGGQYYFLSRPRRFGKSLLISTLEEIFSGNRELFKGLWIYDKIDWKRFPVIHIDFSKIGYDNGSMLKSSLSHTLDKIAAQYNIPVQPELDYISKFTDLIEALSEDAPVVILIDEYDKPIIDFIDKKTIAKENRDILRNFYSALKGLDKHLRFIFITGVSKFSKVSVFSGLNNLDDITLDVNYATMLGYTHAELLHYFGHRLEQLSSGNGETADSLVEDIKAWYNGYSWDGEHFVYNPFSVLNFFHKNKFGNYWFESGSPSFLVKLIKEYNINVPKLENYKAGEAIFGSFDIERLHVVSLLFQTGYLTVKEIQPAGRRKNYYILSYPNSEVKEAFMEYLLGDLSSQFADEISVIVGDLKNSLEKDDTDRFFEIIRALFANIPYDIFITDREGYYQTVIYLILKLIGIVINTEVETNLGRIDTVIETDEHIYVIEFKLGTSEEALNQVKEKKYYEKFLISSKTIKLIGVGFDVKAKNISDYKIEVMVHEHGK